MTVLASSLTGCATMQSTSGSSLYNPAQRVFLVRHAERFNDSRDDPPLTAEGKGRAKALADTPRDARVSAIITSQWMRAKDTAQPLAELLRIAPEGIPTVDPPHGYFQATANACDDEEPIQFWSLDTSGFPTSSPSLAIRNYRRPVKACFSICSCWFRLWGGTASHGFVTALGRRFRRAAENSGDPGPDRN